MILETLQSYKTGVEKWLLMFVKKQWYSYIARGVKIRFFRPIDGRHFSPVTSKFKRFYILTLRKENYYNILIMSSGSAESTWVFRNNRYLIRIKGETDHDSFLRNVHIQ